MKFMVRINMIESILHQPEGKTLEFKKEITKPISFLKTLVAFANTAGGRLVAGVGDDHEIVELGMHLRFIVFLEGSIEVETNNSDGAQSEAQSGAQRINGEQVSEQDGEK